VPGEIDKAAVVDDEAVGILADDRGLHAFVEDLARRPADRLQAAMWQRRMVCRSWWTTKRAQISREKPSTWRIAR
jgi:hypothetical protein